MKGIAILTIAAAALAATLGLLAHAGPVGSATPAFDIKLPTGYRDWRVITVAHEAGNNNDIRAVLGNDLAIDAYRQGKSRFPDGAIVARLAWVYTSSDENNKVFGREQSFVAGAPTNVQFMVKDSKKYASTGGWGYAQFKDGKPDEKAQLGTCFPCHVPASERDYLFSRYAP